MKKLTTTFFIILAVSNAMFSQINPHKFDIKLGAGTGFMGGGDIMAMCFENELTYKFNPYLSSSFNVGIGRTFVSIKEHNDYLLGGLNVFVSPFKNNGRNNFKIGGGFNLINETNTYAPSSLNIDKYPKGIYNSGFEHRTNSVAAFSAIIENEYMITSRFLIGIKGFITGSVNDGGIISGGMVKFGILL